MVSCKLLLLSMLVGTALCVALPSSPVWPVPPVQRCDRYCGTPPNLRCCDHVKRCPQDHRPDYDCTQPQAFGGSAGSSSGPQKCSGDRDCYGEALCCWDSCLGYRKCTNV